MTISRNYRRHPGAAAGYAVIISVIFIAFILIGAQASYAAPPIGSFYYPPGNEPPGPPPNYNQVDTSYFLGMPDLPLPPPDSGGVYIWVDSSGWNIANHIYSQGNSLEQFHGSVLAMLQSPPEPGVNVFADGFELFGDTTSNLCYKQNDRWGWYRWSENLYEIWWDVCTREWQQGNGDPNDFMVINIAGCAIDFNLWSSGHSRPFDTDQIYLGQNMVSLNNVPGFVDTYPGIYDPYQSQAGSDPTTDPNITIFTAITGTGVSYNRDGIITAGQTYSCGKVLGQDYGDRFAGPFVYEGNGIQFSSSCLSDPCIWNSPPVATSPADTSIFACGADQICIPGFYGSDPDDNLLSVEVQGGTLSGDTVCFIPAEGQNTITFICTDECGEADTAITIVTVDFNEAPVAISPNDTSMFVCDLSQICLAGFTYSDADGNISSVDVTGGTLNSNQVCFTPVEGTNVITMIVTDDCGMADTASTVVTIDLNEAPVAGSPADAAMLVCDLGQICLSGFNYNDADNNIASVEVTGGILSGDTVCFNPAQGLNTITMIVTDSCGAADTASTDITVDLNQPPDAVAPNDTSIFVCDLQQICISGFTYSDPDDNIASVEVTGGTLNGSNICFDPVLGANVLTLIVTDDCGEADTAITVVIIELNSPPVAMAPNDTSVFQCGLEEICLPGFSYTDDDDNVVSVNVIGGTLIGDTVCVTPAEGNNLITIIVADGCGEADTASMTLVVDVNSEPVAQCPGDTTVTFTCDVSEVCIGPFTTIDADGNIDSSYISTDGFSGTFDGSNFCFTPNERAIYQINFVTVDMCGAADTCSLNVNVQMSNDPPSVSCPGDTSILACDLSQICLPGFGYDDPDDNIESVQLSGGTYDNGSVCFDPQIGENTIALSVTDSCGLSATCTTLVFITMNSAPQITCMDDTTMEVDDLSEICLPGMEIYDADNNIASIDVVGGYMNDGEVCFTPVAGINTISIIATDECGAADTCETHITIGYCSYMPGDANADYGVNGNDIVLMVDFFKGGPPLPDTCDCRPDLDIYPFFGAGDANGSCSFNGLDVTYLFEYLAYSGPAPVYCPSCPPTAGWITSHNQEEIARPSASGEVKGTSNIGSDK